MIFFFCAIIALAGRYIARRFDLFLGLAYIAIGWQWLYMGFAFYGALMGVGVPSILFLADQVAKNKWLTLVTIRVATWVNVFFSVYEIFGGEPFGAHDPYFTGLVQGAFGHPIVAGIWFAAVVPIALRFWSLPEAIIFIVLTVWTKSSMAILALLGAALFGLWRALQRKQERLFLVALVACAIAALFIGAHFFPHIEFFSFSGRMLPWKRAWELILENPFGYGPGSWNGAYPRWKVEYPRKWDMLHSDILQLIFECGWHTFVLAAIGFWRVLHRLDIWAACGVAAIILNAAGSFPIHITPIAYLLAVLLALGEKERKIEHNL